MRPRTSRRPFVPLLALLLGLLAVPGGPAHAEPAGDADKAATVLAALPARRARTR